MIELDTGEFYLDTPFTVPKKCLKNFHIKSKLLTRGSNGLIYDCSNCPKSKYVMKIILLDVPIPGFDCVPGKESSYRDCLTFSEEQFQHESEMTKLASNLGIGPKYYASWTSPIHEQYFDIK